MKGNILIIEDEDKIARLLEMELTYEGYTVACASTGREGLNKALSGGFDVILLDIMLPVLSGLEVLRRLRETDKQTSVILLTARGATPDKVSGLDLGANDYMTKPFEIEEVFARIRSCLRNRMTNAAPMKENTELVLEDLTIDPVTREVERGGIQIVLTQKEFELLLYLVQNRNQVLNREQIIQAVWGHDFVGETNVVDVYIRYVRKKMDYPFDRQLIHTYRGVGYCIKESEK
ncbi:response regulator transcription factor [Paenibacillus alginolyticus]|uniref:Response regulator transcription factor n=1 Tax=Paenibacillus alginolyticus TaxID=59839 RepID=A0ABT4GGN8_9BACL|nr:response regulator transcription factor [Paenibacillus alginolyticus]MCY9668442.1 response regulator transcription factor [Paenibacillus alginolyticus]MCY9695355.1 response regulator transcription factor [Paenibacillus alginolyticus]MEC0144752.1 response regulator transcription factor [Paenibacillus alginolyticus]